MNRVLDLEGPILDATRIIVPLPRTWVDNTSMYRYCTATGWYDFVLGSFYLLRLGPIE